MVCRHVYWDEGAQIYRRLATILLSAILLVLPASVSAAQAGPLALGPTSPSVPNTPHGSASKTGRLQKAGLRRTPGTSASPNDTITVLDCNWSVSQTWTTPVGPTMNYYASINCSVGTPNEIDMSLWRSNVNTPASYQNLNFQVFNCAVNPCTTAYYAYNPDRTEHLRNSASFFMTGTDGKQYTGGPTDNVWTYNSVGGGYPNFNPSTSYLPFTVFFPSPSFTVCDDNPALTVPPACPRSPTFLADVTNHYTSVGWTIPSCPNGVNPQAHHIKPLAWGGGNNVSNGVLLCPDDHLLYTGWWARGRFDPSMW